MNPATQANFWLNILHQCKHKLMPIYRSEMAALRKLAPILPEKTMKDGDGNVAIFYIDKEKTIGILKSIYSFKTHKEAAQEVTDAAKDH